MIKAPISLQDLRRRIYRKAKAEPAWGSGGCTFMSASWTRCVKPTGWPSRITVPQGLMG